VRSAHGEGSDVATSNEESQPTAAAISALDARNDAAPPEDTPGGLELKFRPDIEGLRAVAVVVVVLFHAGLSQLAGGYIGVDVFFVISGFLITGLLLRERDTRGRISILGFYARRFRRILPAAILVIIGTTVAAYYIQNIITYTVTAGDAKYSSLFAANWRMSQLSSYFNMGSEPSPLRHFWSLAVEEQFYLVWPLLVLLLGVLARRMSHRGKVLCASSVIVVASFVWALHEVTANPTWAFYSPFTRAWELGLGAVAACLAAESARIPKITGVVIGWVGLLAILWAAVFQGHQANNYPGWPALVPVLGAVAVIVGGASGIGAGHFLAFAPVRSVGRVSYGWYLLHWPPMILAIGIIYEGHYIPVSDALWISAATLAGAYLMYYVLERPVRRSSWLARRPVITLLLGAAWIGVALIVASCIHVPLV